MTAIFRPETVTPPPVQIPPQAIVIMVVPDARGRARIQAQWPPTMNEEGVLEALKAAMGGIEQKMALERGGILKASQIPPVEVLT